MAGTRKLIKRPVNSGEQIWIESAFKEFIEDKKSQGVVPETIKSYTTTFKKFYEFINREKEVELMGDIYPSMFIEWRSAMQDGYTVEIITKDSKGKKVKEQKEYKPARTATVNHNLGDIRAFMYWCMEPGRDYLTEHFNIRLMKVQEEKPKDYEPEEIEKLLKKPDRKAKFTEWRSWAICCFVIGTGARLGTLVEIQMKDIKLKEGTIFYQHTKNKKLQNANLSTQLVKCLREYINTWFEDIEDDDYLFCKVDRTQLSKAALTQSYAEYAKSRGVNKTNIHGLRHTFARMWYENGGDVVQLSKILGHSTLAMSEHYMNAYANMARERFEQFNPLDNLARKGTKKTVRRRD